MVDIFNDFKAASSDDIADYIGSHTPSQMLADIRASRIDPNELPWLGDQAMMFLKSPAHARVLYEEGISQLEAAPHRRAPDCDLFKARRNLCLSCLMLGSPLAAFGVLAKEPRLVSADLNLVLGIALALAKAARPEEANAILSLVQQIPFQDLVRKLEQTEWSFDEFESLKASIRKQLGKRTFRDLEWYFNPQAGQPPDGVLDLDLNVVSIEALSKSRLSGIPASVLDTIKSGFVHQASTDGKMWFCEFFDVADPSPLLRRGMPGRFRVDFHTRGGPASIFSVHFR